MPDLHELSQSLPISHRLTSLSLNQLPRMSLEVLDTFMDHRESIVNQLESGMRFLMAIFPNGLNRENCSLLLPVEVSSPEVSIGSLHVLIFYKSLNSDPFFDRLIF